MLDARVTLERCRQSSPNRLRSMMGGPIWRVKIGSVNLGHGLG